MAICTISAGQCSRAGASHQKLVSFQFSRTHNRQIQSFQAVGTASRSRFRTITQASQPLKVAVTGAGGRTGSLAVKQLVANPDKFSVLAIVRSDKSAAKLSGSGVPEGSISVIDIAATGAEAALEQAFRGVDSVIIATSAVPQIKKLSLVPFLFKKFVLRQEGARPQFGWTADQLPEQVDWIGQKAQVDAAKRAGVKQVVLVSSMGGTNEDNPLNALGNGNILVWKRKAEEYLIASGVPYTIIHPGGLIDDKGGERELILDVDDKLIERADKEGTARSIPREDVAALAVSALTAPATKNRSIDCVAKKPEDGTATTDFDALWAGLKADCKY